MLLAPRVCGVLAMRGFTQKGGADLHQHLVVRYLLVAGSLILPSCPSRGTRP